MQRKLIIGLSAAAIGTIVAGAYLSPGITGAQEPVKKAEPEKKADDLFELLKKDLEKPKATLPALPMPKTEDAFPSPVVQAQAQVPAPNPSAAIPPPVSVPPAPTAPPPQIASPSPPPPPPTDGGIAPPSTVPGPGVKVSGAPMPELPAIGIGATPPEPKSTIAPVQPQVSSGSAPPPPHPDPATQIGQPKSAPTPELPALPSTAAPNGMLTPPGKIGADSALTPKLKSSPWSVHVEIVEEQTIVTLSVKKKHEFKILCQHLDLQTAQKTLKATGKVKIVGDALQGSCENLTIALYDDGLILEGAGKLMIDKGSSSVGFELKGEKLNLRIDELEKEFIKTSWQRNPDETPAEKNMLIPTRTVAAHQWSPYGRLRQTKLQHDGETVYMLEGADGQPIVHLIASSNKSLSTYVGRMISVYGTAMEQSSAGPMLHVSHIALP